MSAEGVLFVITSPRLVRLKVETTSAIILESKDAKESLTEAESAAGIMHSCSSDIETGDPSPPEDPASPIVQYHEVNAAEELRIKLRDLDIAMDRAVCLTETKVSEDKEDKVHVTFQAMARDVSDIISAIQEIGIGSDFGTISVIPLSTYKPAQVYHETEEEKAAEKEGERFFEVVESAVIVEQVLASTKAAARWSFDFVALITVAAILAGVALSTNSAVVAVASMLVSPMMGPILCTVLGTIMKDWAMVRMGFKSEIKSLIICVLMGIILSFVMWPFAESYDWPTAEMKGRGEAKGLIIGVIVAIPSGLAVSLSLLGKNANSLVGVAISASLLPPAVNAGMLCTWAIVGPTRWDKDLFVEGLISLVLTLVNITCIYFSALVMFKIKAVAPIESKGRFFGADLNVVVTKIKDEEFLQRKNTMLRHANQQQQQFSPRGRGVFAQPAGHWTHPTARSRWLGELGNPVLPVKHKTKIGASLRDNHVSPLPPIGGIPATQPLLP
eukprot:NODE_1006_length_1944_cov_102.019769_g955_i0.p1 GENE.NODE_1006_length_1944_cov_102.019769_g955_i0~~NODE_1006_length_1944_cov_102.019769_g955_i0.p1  ORF type:complete len:521 (+),score=98.20 NODE_1006_length_1944_cov_102.019769_g955_i0:65-1564(+)